MKPILFVTAWFSLAGAASFGQASSAPYLDPNLPPERRAADLVARMTLEEKVLQMQNRAPAIPRLCRRIARQLSRPHRRTDILVAEHQHLPRSSLGTRAGNLR